LPGTIPRGTAPGLLELVRYKVAFRKPGPGLGQR